MSSGKKDFKPTSWSVDNRTTIYLLTLFITLAGIMVYNRLPKEQFPDIVVPTILVSTIHPGNSPVDVENLISKPIEKQLKSVKGIKKVSSVSISDFSLVTAEFQTGITPALAKERVQSAVDKAKNDLPNDLDRDPNVEEIAFSEFPIMQVNVSSKTVSLKDLKTYAEILEDEIEALPEINRVDIIGGLQREIQVNVDLKKMQNANFSFNDIEGAIASENVNISGGELNVDNVRRTLRVTGEFKSLDDLRRVVVRSSKGNAAFLSELATIVDGNADRQDFARLEGRSVIALNIIKRGGANLIAASDKIQDAVSKAQISKLPTSVEVDITGDTSDFTRLQLEDLINSVIIGFIFVVLVLMFFMGTVNAIFVGLSVPLSILLAFLVMPLLGFTMNVVVMFSFLLALGIVVDDAIVVIENTHRILHKHPELGVVGAAKEAAGEVFIPVLSGTLTNLAPFIPLTFWPGLVGEFMRYLPITLMLTLFSSLLVAFIMNPVFAVSFMNHEDHAEEDNKPTSRKSLMSLGKTVLIMFGVTVLAYVKGIGWGNLSLTLLLLVLLNHFVFSWLIKQFQTNVLPVFMNGYRNFLRFVIKGFRPVVFILGAFILLPISLAMFGASKPNVVFFPGGDPQFTYIYIELPIGTDATVTDGVVKDIENRVYSVVGKNNPNVKSVISNVGIGAGDPQNPDRVVAPHKGKITIQYITFSKRVNFNTADVMEKIRTKVSGIPGVEVRVDKESSGPPTGKPINIEIGGDDFTVLKDLEGKVIKAINNANIQGIEKLKSDLVLNKPEIMVDIDREKARREGISTVQIALAVRTALYGKEVSDYREAKDEYPIQLRLQAEDRKSVEDLMAMDISYLDMATGGFRQIPLGAVASVRYSTSYSQINRKNQQRVVSIGSNVLTGYNANEIVAQINPVIEEISAPDGYTIKMTGEQEDQKETSDFLGFAGIAAIGLILIVLVTQFNSISKPLIILFTIVLSLIGVFFGFALTHETFSIVITGVGIISLGGIVVKNGILLIEFTDELRKRGLPLRDAIVEAGATRLTPVLLTASAAVLGLIPLAVGININFESLFNELDPKIWWGGDSAAFWGPLAWAIVYGLTFCTFLTLVLVPCMYWVRTRLKARIYRIDQERVDFENMPIAPYYLNEGKSKEQIMDEF